jgi:hypothetical protein
MCPCLQEVYSSAIFYWYYILRQLPMRAEEIEERVKGIYCPLSRALLATPPQPGPGPPKGDPTFPAQHLPTGSGHTARQGVTYGYGGVVCT